MTNILLRIFVKTFYKKYAKLFIIGFCLIFSYFFFIQIAGVFLINTRDYWTLFLSIQVATEPFFMTVFTLFALIYLRISLKFMKEEIDTPPNRFLKESFFSTDAKSRWKNYVIIFLLINLPILGYILYATAIASFLYASYQGWFIFLFLLTIIFLSAYHFDNYAIHPSDENSKIRKWRIWIKPPLPLFSINIFNLLANNTWIVLIVKILSILSIYIAANLVGIDLKGADTSFITFLGLTIASFNAILIYRDYIFEGNKMQFTLNFPRTLLRRFVMVIPMIFLLLVPEVAYLGYKIDFYSFLFLTATMLIFLMLIRSLIHAIGNRPVLVLKIWSTIFFLSLIMILYKLHVFVLLIATVSALLLYSKNFRFEKIKDKQDF